MDASVKQRKPWVDAIRALAIIFVVFGHCVPHFQEFFDYTSPIKIPLFFAISGYVFNPRVGKIKVFFNNWIKKLVLPYFMIALIPIIMFSLYYGLDYFTSKTIALISGDTYWFMPCLIIAEVLLFLIIKFSKRDWQIFLITILLFVMGLVLAYRNQLSFAMINVAFQTPLYMLIGYYFKKHENVITQMPIWMMIIGVVVYVISCLSKTYMFNDTELDLHLSHYYNIPHAIFTIILGCIVIFMVAQRIYYAPRWLVYIGQNTLVIYLWAGISYLPFIALSKFGFGLPGNEILSGIIKTLWALITCGIASHIINKYFPFLLGRKHK